MYMHQTNRYIIIIYIYTLLIVVCGHYVSCFSTIFKYFDECIFIKLKKFHYKAQIWNIFS